MIKGNLSEILLHALLYGGVEEILKCSHEYLGYPVMVVDGNYNLIANYPAMKIDDPLWDAIFEFEMTPPYFINKLHIEDMMRLGVNEVKPYYIDWGFLQNYPRILVNLISDGKLYGYFSVVCRQKNEELMQDVQLIGSVLSVALKKQNIDVTASEDYQIMFLKHLFDNDKMSKNRLKNWEKYLAIPLMAPFCVVSCSYNISKDVKFTMNYMKSMIHNLYPNVLFITKKNHFIFLFTNKIEEVSLFVSTLEDTFMEYGLRFGISNQFLDLEKASVYLGQAEYALSLAEERKLTVMKYKDCILDQIITAVYASMPRENYIHEAIEKIKEYDEKNNTEYLKTLKVYMNTLCCAKDTVEMLHIHRNTLPHRIEMIEKIGEINLKDKNTGIILLLNFFMQEENE